MCGIVGIFNYSGNESLITTGVLEKMSDEIQHRGPDDNGVFVSTDKHVGLAFRRLSIVDLSEAGHQPMSANGGSVWLVFNGEIYNHLMIRKDLEDKGYRYHSRTDTETILYAYLEYGLDFISKLYGMFAIAIWDSRIDQLLLVRDRIGIKPLYYTTQAGALFFASEIKAIVKHPHIDYELNEQGMYDYLSLLVTPPNESLFRGIHKLEAGHYLTINKKGDIYKKKYWDLTHQTEVFDPTQFSDESFCIENIRRLLRDSIKLRMMSDVPFGVLLSGGIDSSLNVALMSEQMSRPVETFSVGYKDLERYNELAQARQVSQQFKTNHHEILLEERDLIDFLPKMIWHQDEPNADPVCVPMFFVSKLARDSGTIVVQVGEGSDEQFAGYMHYLREMRFQQYYYRLLPSPAQQIAYKMLKKLRPNWVLTDYARRAAHRDAPFYGGAIAFTEELKTRLATPKFSQVSAISGRIASEYSNRLRGMENGAPINRNFLREMIYFEFKSRLAELLLMRVDKMSMATSIEARVPFLDHRLVEFSFRIPTNLKTKNRIPKYILKRAAEGIIPDDIIYRKKQGFAAPVREWLRTGKLAGFARDHIFGSDLLKLGFFNAEFINYMFVKHTSGQVNFDREIWSLLVLCMWYDTFMSKKVFKSSI